MIEKLVLIVWLCVFVMGIYFLVQLLRLNARLNIDLEELEKADEMFNLDLENFEKITFMLVPDEHGTIYDKEGNKYRLEKQDDK